MSSVQLAARSPPWASALLPQEEGWADSGAGSGWGWGGRQGGALRLPLPAPLPRPRHPQDKVLGAPSPSEMLELERGGGVQCGADAASRRCAPWG